MNEDEINALRYNQGLIKIMVCVAQINDYDWNWFLAELKKRKTPIADLEDESNLRKMAETINSMRPMIDYFEKRGGQIQKQASKANLN